MILLVIIHDILFSLEQHCWGKDVSFDIILMKFICEKLLILTFFNCESNISKLLMKNQVPFIFCRFGRRFCGKDVSFDIILMKFICENLMILSFFKLRFVHLKKLNAKSNSFHFLKF